MTRRNKDPKHNKKPRSVLRLPDHHLRQFGTINCKSPTYERGRRLQGLARALTEFLPLETAAACVRVQRGMESCTPAVRCWPS